MRAIERYWLMLGAILSTFFLVSTSLGGCGPVVEETATSTTSSPPVASEAPQLDLGADTPAPGLASWEATPEAGKAVLRGRIVITEPTVLLGELFLAKAVPTSNPDIELLELDEAKAPRAEINRESGEFLFLNVEPGKWGLIAWEPLSGRPVSDPETGATLFVVLAADTVTDVGTLYLP